MCPYPTSRLNCLPRSRRFVEDMRAFHAEPNAIKRDEIAARQALAHGRPEPEPTPRKKAAKKYRVIRLN